MCFTLYPRSIHALSIQYLFSILTVTKPKNFRFRFLVKCSIISLFFYVQGIILQLGSRESSICDQKKQKSFFAAIY